MVTGFVLAGGSSSRMGRDKALLPLRGRPLVERVIARLRPCVERLYVIGSERNHRLLRGCGADGVLVDLYPDRGPLMGLYTGLMHTHTPLNVFAACDMPWIEPALVYQLLASWSAGVEVVASRGPHNRLCPLPLVCHASLHQAIGALLDQREGALHALLRRPSARVVPLHGPAWDPLFRNVNTAVEYAEAQR